MYSYDLSILLLFVMCYVTTIIIGKVCTLLHEINLLQLLYGVYIYTLTLEGTVLRQVLSLPKKYKALPGNYGMYSNRSPHIM